MSRVLLGLVAAGLVEQSLALNGWISKVYYNNPSCSAPPVEAVSTGPIEIGASCDAYFNANPSQAAARNCVAVAGSPNGWYQVVQCQLQDAGAPTTLPCPSGATGSWSLYQVYTDAGCTQPLVEQGGSYRTMAEGVCTPANWGDSAGAYQRTNCTGAYISQWADAACGTPLGFPEPSSQVKLNSQCNAEGRPGVGYYAKGQCRVCSAAPPAPPPGPSPSPSPSPVPPPSPPIGDSGLSGGAIAGIVLGTVAVAAGLVALFVALGKRKRPYIDPVADLPLQETKEVVTVQEVTEVKSVPVTETVSTIVAPAVATTVATVPAVATTVATVPTVATTVQEVTTTTVGATSVGTTQLESSGVGLNPVNQYQVGSQYTAAGNYVSSKPTELTVNIGDFIKINEVNADGWVNGTKPTTGESGWFPIAALKGGY